MNFQRFRRGRLDKRLPKNFWPNPEPAFEEEQRPWIFSALFAGFALFVARRSLLRLAPAVVLVVVVRNRFCDGLRGQLALASKMQYIVWD
jgi:hypothetical protein